MIIADNIARAILLIHIYGGHFDRKKLEDEPWFKGGVAPHFHRLKHAGYIKSNGFDDEFTLTEGGKDAYQEWYLERGFDMDRAIEHWREYSAVMDHGQ